METNIIEQIKRFQEFIGSNYYNSLLENVRKGNKSLLIDFAELSKYDPDLATELLDAPEETIKAIEKAQIGFSVSNTDNLIHATLSPLSDERREELARIAKKNTEEARIHIRHARDEILKKAKALEEKGELTEDEMFALKEKVQEIIDDVNQKAEELLAHKIAQLKK